MIGSKKIFALLTAAVVFMACGVVFSQVPDTTDQRVHTFFKSPVNNQSLSGAWRLYEAADQTGNNWFGIRAAVSLSQNQPLIWPVAPPSAGQVLSAVTSDSLKWIAMSGGSGSPIVTRLGGTSVSTSPTDFDFSSVHFIVSDANKADSVEIELAAAVSLLGQSIETGEITDGTITGDDINSSFGGSGLVLTPGSPDILDFAPSELTNITFGNGGAATGSITFDLSAGDPTITFGNAVVNVSSGTLQQGGTAVVLQTRTVGTSAPLAGGGALSGDLTLSVSANGINATHIDETAQYNFTHVSNQFRAALFHGDTLRFYDDGGIKAEDDTLYFFTAGGDVAFKMLLSDVPSNSDVLKISNDNVASWQPDAGGEANTASNLGGGLANYDSKSGVDLRFNTFASADFDLASNLITIDDTKWAKDSELHAAVTLATDADVLLGLSTQQLTLDAQNANIVFAGPASGGAVDPTFRALVDDDIPNDITITNLSGTNSGDVTLAGTPDYITISGQVITRAEVALTTHTSGSYVASVATTSPLAGGAVGSEGAALTLSISADGINATHIDETASYVWSGASTVTGSLQFDGDALRILDTGADHYLTITPGTNLSANRVFTLTTGDAARNLTMAGDATISGTNTGDVSLAGTPDYITISGQTITRNQLDIADDLNTFDSAALAGRLTDESGSAGVFARLNLTTPAQGDVLYYNGTNWVNLAPGTSGQVLHTQGAGANPIWDADDGAGGGAPIDATYITQIANGTLTQEQALAALATGIMASTTTTGVVATRVLTGTAGAVQISNGDGSGNPTFTLPAAITVPTSYAIGSDPADAGVLRLENAAVIAWESAPAGPDITLTVDASEVMQVSGTFNAVALTEGGNAVYTTADGSLSDDDLSNNSIDDLSDVVITTAAAAHILVRNSGNTAWENVAVSGDGSISAVGALTINDDSHAHTTTTISGLDLANDLNTFTSAALFGRLTDETGSASGSPLAVFNQNPTLAGATVSGGNISFSDGSGDSPLAVFTPETATAWNLGATESNGDFNIFSASTASTENVNISNPGAGVATLTVEGAIGASNFSGSSSGTNTGDEVLSTSSAGLDVSDHAVDLDLTPSSGSATLEQSEDALQVKYDSEAFTEGAGGLTIAAGGIDGGSGGDIADGTITADDLANATVSNAKLSNMAQNTIKMRVASGAGDPEDIDISSGLALVTAASGDFVIIEDATDGGLKRVDASDFLGGGSAPTDATYITQTPNGTLSAEQALSALASGMLASTTTTGVVASRVLTGTAGAVEISNGDGSGNPTFTLPSAITVPSSYSIGSDPADAGVIRLENAAVIAWEAAPAGPDVTLTVDASEIMQASGTFNAVTLTEGGNAVYTTADGALNDDDLSNNSVDDLSDVTITSASAGHLLVRNAGNTAWENVALSGDGSLNAAGALAVNDDSHAHTTTTISGLDLANDLNTFASTALFGRLTDETGSASGSPLAVFNQNPTLAGATVSGGNLAFSDGAGDSPQATFTPQTGTAWSLYVEDTGDDFQIEVNTGATEMLDIVNAGAGTINLNIDGTITASNFSGSSSGTNTGDDDVDDEAIHDNVSGEIAAITAKATPTTSDFLLIEDAAASNAKKSITIGAMEAALEGVLDLDELQGNLTGSKVNFADTDGNWTATNVQAALEELDDVINGGVPNSATAKVDWSQLFNVPAGFADGSDDGGGGGSWSDLTAPTDAVSMVSDGTSETATFDFQAAFTTGNQFTIKQTTGNPSGGSLFAVQAADANVSPIILLENTAAVTIPIALQIAATNASGVITTAIDVSDGEIVTALAIGSNDVTVGGATISSAEFAALDDGITLTTETNGSYVASVATTSPLAGGAAGSEGATLTLSISADGINATHIDETAAYAWSGASTVTGSMQFDGDALRILDAGADHYLTITPGTDLSVNRVLMITTGDAARNLTFAGDATISGTNSGDQTITLTGNVTGSGTGTFATTIAEDVVTAAMMANGDHGAFTYTTNIAALDVGSVSGGSGGVITDGSITSDDLGTNSVGADELQADALLWNEIGDAGADATIALGANETDFTSTIDAAGEAVITITNTDADAANDNSFIDLRHNDGADANVFYLRMIGDNDGSPVTDYSMSQTAFLIGAGVATTFSSTVSASALTEGANAVPNATDHLGFFAATTSAQLAGVLSDEEGSGGGFVRATSPTITTPTISGAITFPDGVRQTFNPDGTNAGINVGSQAGDPSSPSNGDLWYNSSTNELTARINGASVDLGAGGSSDIVRSWTLENPTGAENFGAITFPFAVTVQEVRAVLVGSATPSVTMNFSHGSDRSGSGATNLFSSGQAITSTTTGHTLSSFNDATVAADEWFWFTTSAQSGTVSEIVVSVHFTVD